MTNVNDAFARSCILAVQPGRPHDVFSDETADLVVMGGYGHSRLREWLLGGVTYDLLHHAPVPLLVAH